MRLYIFTWAVWDMPRTPPDGAGVHHAAVVACPITSPSGPEDAGQYPTPDRAASPGRPLPLRPGRQAQLLHSF